MTAMEYIELSGVPESRWPTFRQWFGWYKRHNLVGVVKDGGEIAGVALARMINESDEPVHYLHRPNGDTAFVDLTVTSVDGRSTARSRLAMKHLLSILWDEFGPRRSLIFNRNGVKKKYNYMKFMQKAMA
jgi:hypothetical protein